MECACARMHMALRHPANGEKAANGIGFYVPAAHITMNISTNVTIAQEHIHVAAHS